MKEKENIDNLEIKKRKETLKKILISLVITAVFLKGLNYILLFTINVAFPGLIIAYCFLFLIFNGINFINQNVSKRVIGIAEAISGGIIILMIIIRLIGSPIFFAETYKNSIGEVEKAKFTEDVSPIDLKQLPVIDGELAKNLADKKLGEMPALGSQVEVGDPTIQQVNGKLIYVIPLEHSGFFKWFSNKNGTPGYITVSATNPDDIKLITETNGQKLNLKYIDSAFFSSDIARYSYSKVKTKGMMDYSFELDDSGRPYWVISEFQKLKIFSGTKITGVLIIDVQTGESKEYSLNEVPKWVDRVYPINVVRKYIDSWGELVHGFINFSHKDQLTSTEGIKAIYNNGNCYYYTGISSVGKDESSIGFMLVNTRTGKANLYEAPGATELAGAKSAMGKMQEKNFKATFPILINVQNNPTYFTTLKDYQGLVKMYAMVNVKSYSIVATGETVQETLNSYINLLAGRGEGKSLETTGKSKEGSGTVLRAGILPIDKTTVFYIITKENPKKLIIVPSGVSKELPLTKEGDRISYKYVEMQSKDINAKDFDNKEINLN